MLVKNTYLYELDGTTTLNVQDRQNAEAFHPLTVAQVIIQAALGVVPGQTMPTDKSVARYELSKAAWATAIDGDFDVPDHLIQDLQKDLVRGFGPMVVGQVAPLLSGKVVPLRPSVREADKEADALAEQMDAGDLPAVANT